ncbi:hypothetical protein BDR26DRAFT_1014831 [Obelidium mucronatum]|nr:hypothetical protein BDR26DRAFT_1014831 [Obelidium mucronatum]
MPNTKVLFRAIPNGPATKDAFDVVRDEHFDVSTQELGPDSILVKTTWLSLDPYMRGRMRKPEVQSYSPAFAIGQPMGGHGVGVVLKSTSNKYKEGDAILGFLPWVEYAVLPAAQVNRVINKPQDPILPNETWLGLLGMPSFTAYAGLIVIAKPKAGETLFVSAAAGAVGQVVGQIGKRLGLRVVGSCGTDDKVEYLINKLGFDAAFNYNKHNIHAKLSELCPKGIDIYFENVGGETLDAVLQLMNVHGRIPVCGMISQYNGAGDGIKNLLSVIPKRILIQGFLQSDYVAEHHEEFLKWMFANAMDACNLLY